MTENKETMIQRLAEEHNVDQAMGDPLLAMREAYDSGYRARDTEVAALRRALNRMIGWAKYAESCDSFYFSEEQAPEWKQELAEAEAILAQTKPATKAKP
jgi:hypothetical protein